VVGHILELAQELSKELRALDNDLPEIAPYLSRHTQQNIAILTEILSDLANGLLGGRRLFTSLNLA